MLGGNQTARAGTDDRHTCTGSQPHMATLSDLFTRRRIGFVHGSAVDHGAEEPRVEHAGAARIGLPQTGSRFLDDTFGGIG
jgi:hypothetical protein